MNIFYLDTHPINCARMHCDKHVVKMILEYAQLMCTAHHLLDGGNVVSRDLYKITHQNHPSAIWARQSYENYSYLYLLFNELCSMYTKATGKTHATYALLGRILYNHPKNIDMKKAFMFPPSCMKDEFKIHQQPTSSAQTIENYKNYYLVDKVRFAKFGKYNNPTPKWWKDADV